MFRADSDINFEVDSVNSIIFYDKRQQQQPAGVVYSTADKTGIRRIFNNHISPNSTELILIQIFLFFYFMLFFHCRIFINYWFTWFTVE